MTSKERFRRMFQHKEADRIPMIDSPWQATIARWRREGLPEKMSPAEFFDFDLTASIGSDNSPRYPVRTVEETDEYVISTTAWGATLKNWKHHASTPEFLDFTIKDRESWEEARERMTPTPDRINWQHLEKNYSKWVEQGAWIAGNGWFGYDVFASWHIGTERMLVAMIEDPEWCRDMFETSLDLNLRLLEMVWDKGYRFDCLVFPDDLGYKNGLFFSPRTFRDVLAPVHKKAHDWAHDRGVYTMMHSCGNIMSLIDDLIEIGLDALNPIETKAGMDLVAVKEKYGDRLVIQGGIDVRLMSKPGLIEEEIRTKITRAKQGGGYIYHSDHSVPEDVSLQDYQRVMELVRKYGAY